MVHFFGTPCRPETSGGKWPEKDLRTVGWVGSPQGSTIWRSGEVCLDSEIELDCSHGKED